MSAAVNIFDLLKKKTSVQKMLEGAGNHELSI